MNNAILSLIQEAQDQWQMPAISVGISTASGERWAEGFGIADLENNIPATARTVYRMASISKPITAVAALQLAERGQLDLDAPVQQYVPTFPEKPWPVTSRQLISHLAGMLHWKSEENKNCTHYPYDATPLLSFLERFQDDPLLHEPGTAFRYSTYGYNLLGCVIEGASGSRYLDYVRENIFRPAGMEHTGPDDVQAIIPHRARGYVRENDILRQADFVDTSPALPGAGFCGTVEDIARFGIAVQSGLLLSKETIAEMVVRQRTRSEGDTRFGLGWFTWNIDGKAEIAHGGKFFGTSTMLHVRLDDGVAVAVMTNLQGVTSPFMHGLARQIGGLALEPNDGNPVNEL